MTNTRAEALKIFGYTSDPTTSGGGSAAETFEAAVNPGSFKHYKSLKFNQDNVANASNDVKLWQGYGPEMCTFSLVIDGTGYASEVDGYDRTSYNEEVSVKRQLEKLNKVVYDYSSGIHKPMWVVIQWKDFEFKGHLKSMGVEYQLFDHQGTALLAEVDLSFVVHEDREASQKANNSNSPDMSHIKVIRSGDKLPNLCHEIYDDPTYYLQIAELNGLTNFRDIKPGMKLLFPPLID
jgi:hypothetical protein